MIVRICRGVTGDYCLFHPDCNPVNMGASQWACKCEENHFIFLMSAKNFQIITGIPDHLEVGESRLIEWKLPLKERVAMHDEGIQTGKCVVCGEELESRTSDAYPGGTIIEGYHCPRCGIEHHQLPTTAGTDTVTAAPASGGRG